MMAKERVDSPDLTTPKRTHTHPSNTNSRILSLKRKNVLKPNKRTDFTSSIVGQLVFYQKVDIYKL